LKEAYKTVPLW